ncbi:MAG: hypothetical protein KAX31_01230 [Thermoplasmata archaeon]|nr:hypothetical protein [Thermoplasmata archaeon]
MPGGYGRGNRYRRTGSPGWMRSGQEPGLPPNEYGRTPNRSMPLEYSSYPPMSYPNISPEQELEMLKQDQEMIESQLEQVKERIRELEEWEENPAVNEVYYLLPKVDCGRCGYPTCVDCARAVVSQDAPPDACAVLGMEIKSRIVQIIKNKKGVKL